MAEVDQYLSAYDAALARWPVPVDVLELPSAYRTTRVNACGPASAPPLVLLPGGFATSTVWSASVAALSAAHRVYAVDVICDQGRSVASGTPVDSLPALMAWLDTVLDGRSKVHSIARVEAGARAGIHDLTIRTLPQASHFTLFAEHAQELNRELLEFLG